MFTAEVLGAEQLAHDWVNVRACIRGGARHGVTKGVKDGADEARRNHTFQNRTGALEKSIIGEVTGSSDHEHRGRIAAWRNYASFVDEGTKAHEIRPKKPGGWLHWEEPQGDHHFAKRVMHPGTTALPFMHLAYFKAERVIIREIEIGISQAQAILNR